MEYLPEHGKAKGVQIDDKADRIGDILRFPIDAGLVGDAKCTLAALSPLVERKDSRDFLEEAQSGMKDWWELMETQGTYDSVPIKPQCVAYELSKLASDDAIISTDSGTITPGSLANSELRGRQKFSCSGTLATMAPGLPYAIAAQIAYP